MSRRPASLMSWVVLAFWLIVGARIARALAAERYLSMGLNHLAALTVHDIVVAALPWLLVMGALVALAGRASMHRRGLAAVVLALPFFVIFAMYAPDMNEALRDRLARWPRAGVLAAFAVAGPLLALLASGLVAELFGRPLRALTRRRTRLREHSLLRTVFHPRVAAIGASAILATWGYPKVVAPDPAPHAVVVISIDTLRADHLGVYGYHRDTSPRIDEWAESATVFESGISQASWTKPSVASLFTSLYPTVHQTGSGTRERREVKDGVLRMVPAPEHAVGTVSTLPASLVTVAEVFRNAGYATKGLLANNLIGAADGYGQGFAEYDNFDDVTIAARAARWLKEHEGEPVFLYLHFMAPHAPYDPPSKYDLFTDGDPHIDIHHTASKDSINFTRQKQLSDFDVQVLIDQYDGEIRFADELVGRVLDVLAEPGWSDRTMVALLSDHGEEFMEHGMVWHEPTRFYQELTRVPTMVKVPGAPATRVAQPVMTIDLAPTCLDFAGLTAPPVMQGRSYLPLLRGESLPPRAAYAEALDWGVGQAVWRGVDKLHYDHETPSLQLYNLGTDFAERVDHLRDDPATRAALVDSASRRWTSNLAIRSEVGEVSGTVSEDQLERLKSLGYAQ